MKATNYTVTFQPTDEEAHTPAIVVTDTLLEKALLQVGLKIIETYGACGMEVFDAFAKIMDGEREVSEWDFSCPEDAFKISVVERELPPRILLC